MKIPITKPTLPLWEVFSKAIHSFYDTGMITNGPIVRQLELQIRDTFQVREAVGVSSCTSGLMLALKLLGVTGKVALPSFTFFATAHAAIWNDLEPVFVDIDPETWDLSTAALENALENEEGIEAVMPVHIFGNPCRVEDLKALSDRFGARLIFDSAHAMGAKVDGTYIGNFGDAEVFSLSPTKLVTGGEGGIIATQNEGLAAKLRAGRDYGNEGDYDPSFVGLNARMSEIHAALAIESFRMLELNVRRRNMIAERYAKALSGVNGITFQKIDSGNRSTYKDFTILVDEELFGINRDALARYLANEGIDTRKYYDPPVHRTKAYWEKWGRNYDDFLPVTNAVSKTAISLPIWSHMGEDVVDFVAGRIVAAHENADQIGSSYPN